MKNQTNTKLRNTTTLTEEGMINVELIKTDE